MTAPTIDGPAHATLDRVYSLTDEELRVWASSLRAVPAVMGPLVELAKTLVLTDVPRAERICANLVTASEELGDAGITARALTARAHALSALNRFDEAIAALERAAAMAEQSGALSELAGALVVAVQPYSRMGALDRALAAATRARDIFDCLGDPIGAAKASVNSGVVLRQLDDPEAALLRFAAARATFASNASVVAQIDSNSAEALLELNRFAESEAAFDSSLSQFKLAGNLRAAAIVEGNLADLLNRQGRLDESLRRFEQAIRSFETGAAPGDLSRLLTERAEVYAALGLWELARADLDIAIPELGARGMSIELSRAQIARAAVYLEMQEHDAGRLCLQDAMAALTLLGHPTGVARAAAMMARLHVRENEHDKAVSLLNEAIRQLACRPAERAKLLVAMGECLFSDNKRAAAVTALSEAIVLAEDLGISPLLADALHARARVQLQEGKRTDVLLDFSRAMDAMDRVRGKLPGEHSRVAFSDYWSGLYEDAAAAMLLGAKLSDRSRAFAIVERARCRALLDRVRGDLRRTPMADESAEPLTAELRSLTEELNALFSRSSDLSFAEYARTFSRGWRSRVESCEQRLAAVEIRLAATVEFSGIFGRPVDVASTAASLSPGVVLIQYTVLHGDLIAFVVGSDGLRDTVRLCLASTVETQAARLEFQVTRWISRSGTGHPGGSPSLARSIRHELTTLYRQLIAPIEHCIADARRVVVSPAGPTHGVPIEALVSGEQFFIERVAVTYTPSASVLVDLNRSRQRRERLDDREARTVIVASPDEQAPWITAEAVAVASAAPRPVMLLGDDARVDRFLAEIENASHVHVACHALAPDASPFSARLKLSDRWITAREIAGLRLGGSDVVLSGCETGRGAAAGCEELFGLVRAFLAAGAGSVTATRWPVHDRHTTSLMLSAYSHLATTPEPTSRSSIRSISDGIRAAQIEAATKGWHPATWASFLTMGGTT